MSGTIKSLAKDRANPYSNYNDIKLLYKITKSPNTTNKLKKLKPLEPSPQNSVSTSTTIPKSPNTSINSYHDSSPLIRSAQYPQVSNTTTASNKSIDNLSKYKTEMCKNMLLKGNCKWGPQCSFAHDQSELQCKGPYNHYYKTKICKYYTDMGFCPYALKCQFLHVKSFNAYNELLGSYEKKVSLKMTGASESLEDILDGTAKVGERLSVFKALMERNGAMGEEEGSLESIFN